MTKLLIPCLLLLLAAACAKQEVPTAATEAASAVDSAKGAATATADSTATEAEVPEGEAPETGVLDPGAIELTMPRVERWLAATAKIAGLMEKDPALEDVTAMDASESMETYVARLESHPAVVAAIESAGETPRDYALTSAAVTAAMFAQGMLEAGAIKQLPDGMNQQHIDFVREHKDEIAAKMKALKPAGVDLRGPAHPARDAMATIRTRRVHDDPAPRDGVRVLVDRIWPRGVSRERAAVALWLKEIAPSTPLRKWFGHDRQRWDGFRQRYFDELDAMPDVVAQLRAAAGNDTLTLVYSARDAECNQAVALSEYLQRQAPAAPPAPPSAPPRRSRPGAGSGTWGRRRPRR